MKPLAINQSKSYTYKDYLGWPEDERWELIDGRAYDMTPALSRRHQKILVQLVRHFANFLAEGSCEVYTAPFDVRLAAVDDKDEDIINVVQPDLVVVCDLSKLDDKGCKGSPDLIVEIVSPSTGRKDVKEKFMLYEQSGVKEYWVVDPEKSTVMLFQLGADGRYGRPDVFSEEDSVEVARFPGLTITLDSVFRD